MSINELAERINERIKERFGTVNHEIMSIDVMNDKIHVIYSIEDGYIYSEDMS